MKKYDSNFIFLTVVTIYPIIKKKINILFIFTICWYDLLWLVYNKSCVNDEFRSNENFKDNIIDVWLNFKIIQHVKCHHIDFLLFVTLDFYTLGHATCIHAYYSNLVSLVELITLKALNFFTIVDMTCCDWCIIKII